MLAPKSCKGWRRGDVYVTQKQCHTKRGDDEIQLDLFLSYGSNPTLYPGWQEYFRKHQPPMLIVWGKNDQIFPAAGAEPYKRDLKTGEYHLLDTGHFALEEEGDTIAMRMREFFSEHVGRERARADQKRQATG